MPTLPTCTIPGCDNTANRNKRTLCEKHYYRLRRNGTTELTRPQRKARRHGSPDIVLPTFCKWGPDHPSWKENNIGRVAAHQRVVSRRGSAKTHLCVDCGLPASHWSYDHADPNEFKDERGSPTSGDPSHYQARCVPCHKRFDLDYLATIRKGVR